MLNIAEGTMVQGSYDVVMSSCEFPYAEPLVVVIPKGTLVILLNLLKSHPGNITLTVLLVLVHFYVARLLPNTLLVYREMYLVW